MDGILLINKPMGFTSHDVVAKMRGILKTKKIGHAGTLDPMATGVLPLFIGVATKAVDMQQDDSKRYRATFRLGIATDTQDITGTVLEERPVSTSSAEVQQLLKTYVGESEQIPPMYSAVKIDGKRLYQLARQGKVIHRPPRPITIYSLDFVSQQNHDYTIDVHCSGGTYMRTLCHDVGEKLGCGGTLTALERTAAGPYKLEDCLSISAAEELKKGETITDHILSVQSVFASLPALHTTAAQATHLFNGVRMTVAQFPLPADDRRFAVYAPNNIFIGVAKADQETGQLRLEKLFAQEVVW